MYALDELSAKLKKVLMVASQNGFRYNENAGSVRVNSLGFGVTWRSII